MSNNVTTHIICEQCGITIRYAMFNADAYREAVVNAFVHNRWVDFNSPMFCAYSDRVEILSHGALPPKQTLQGFFEGVSVPVNRELSDIFLQLHISERTGRGVPKIVGAYDQGVFAFGENTVSVILPYDRLQVGGVTPQVNTQVNTQVDTQVDAQVKRLETQVLLFCSIPKSMLELTQLLHVKDRRTVKRIILPLLEQGRLAMTIPDKPNSRFQKYITIK